MRCLLTDSLFPNKFAKWRLCEILEFIQKYETDIMVLMRPTFVIQEWLTFEFDYEELKVSFNLKDYDILICDPRYNYINKYNEIDGTTFNHKFNCTYILRLKKHRNETFNVLNYNFIYHLFLDNFRYFNNSFVYEYLKQYIHCYPTGFITNVTSLANIPNSVKIISTQKWITEFLIQNNLTNYIEIYGGSFFFKDEIPKIKISNKEDLNVCFTSIGDFEAKGGNNYLIIAEKYKHMFPEDKVNFYSVGVCKDSKFITHHKPMSQEFLNTFYHENIDVSLDLTRKGNMGFPHGVESIIQGVLLLMTDYSNMNQKNNFNFDEFCIINVESESGLNNVVNKIKILYEDKQLLNKKQQELQNRIYELFNFENTLQKIFYFIEKNQMSSNFEIAFNIRKSIIADMGGCCPLDKLEFVFKLIDSGNINNNNINNENKKINKIIEIGLYRGAFSLPVASYSGVSTIGVDPYQSYLQKDITDGNVYNIAKTITEDQKYLDSVFEYVQNKAKEYNLNNFAIVRKTSNEAVSDFEDNSIDLLHIDGCHDYQFVKDDINNFYPKISKFGYVIFDDTNWESVKKAYDEFVFQNNVKIVKETSNWICIQKL